MSRTGALKKREKARDKERRKPVGRAVELELTSLEVASGYDGLFRGAPDPVIVVAAYAIGAATEPRTLLRHAFRVDVATSRMPATIPTRLKGKQPVRSSSIAGEHVLLVAVGIEDDGGDGASRVFGALEQADQLALASDEGVDIEPLAALASSVEAWASPRRALLLVDGRPLGASVLQDDWVGACAVTFPLEPRNREHRMHLVSDDGKNDWTAVLLSRLAF